MKLDDLDWDGIGDFSVEPGVLNALVYMRDVEGFTDRELSGLTAHRTTLADPIIERFLHVWRIEESAHSQALDLFLRRYAQAHGGDVPDRQMPPPADAPLVERVVARVRGPVGTVVAAAHMTWGAANELLTLNGYRILATRCGHPLLTELLSRIAAQESRHYSFYVLQAEWRLASSRLARWALHRVMSTSWTPVGIGSGYKTHEEFDVLLRYLGRGDVGPTTIARMDARFSKLPGFADLRIYAQATAALAA